MNNDENLNHITEEVKFYQIKEMLFCMDGLSVSDKEMVEIINSNGGLDNFFEEVKERYISFEG